MEAKQCDRCGALYSIEHMKPAKYWIGYHDGNDPRPFSKDLCPACEEALVKFMDGDRLLRTDEVEDHLRRRWR